MGRNLLKPIPEWAEYWLIWVDGMQWNRLTFSCTPTHRNSWCRAPREHGSNAFTHLPMNAGGWKLFDRWWSVQRTHFVSASLSRSLETAECVREWCVNVEESKLSSHCPPLPTLGTVQGHIHRHRRFVNKDSIVMMYVLIPPHTI